LALLLFEFLIKWVIGLTDQPVLVR
jgi:hypothetical protein